MNSEFFFDEKVYLKSLNDFFERAENYGYFDSYITVNQNKFRLQYAHPIFPFHLGNISKEFIAFLYDTIKNEQVLDVGTGCGIYSIVLSKNGNHVLGIDIDKKAIITAKNNAFLNKSDAMFKLSDLYNSIDKERFDIIVANLPFVSPSYGRKFQSRPLYNSIFYNQTKLEKFIIQSKRLINDKGRVLFLFSSSGNLNFLFNAIGKSMMKSKIIKKIERRDLGETFLIIELSN